MKSRVPVIILVAVILMGVVLWAVLAIRNAGGVDPERAKTLAEEAENECVLEGYGADRCPELVGQSHRDCLAEAKSNDDGAGLDEKGYISCMERHFEAETRSDAGGTDAGSDAADPSGPPQSSDTDAADVGDASTDTPEGSP